ncbi:SPT2 chromatin domain-containing protein [Histoplasma ohiense]|nr:SPT2 chromatin domain-containing protein [Histoplasma ohiense (nom. inval.)]
MSFLNSVLSSIETGDITSISTPATRNPAPRSTSSISKPSSTPSSKAQADSRTTLGQKRRAEYDVRPKDHPFKVSRSSSPQRSTPRKSTPTQSLDTKLRSAPRSGAPNITTKPPSALSPTKPPPKGSYAEMMLRAKALQEKAPMQLGMIKHHSIAKEKQLQQKRKAMEAKGKGPEEEKNKKGGTTTPTKAPNANGQQITKSNAGRAALLKSRGESEYKGTARPPSTPSASAYKGTAGLPSRHASSHGRSMKKISRAPIRDEYLATDEEDEGDFCDDDDDGGYYSDESADMEAGLMDVEEEEQRALRAAKLEDEKERLAELAAKREKMERKKKPDALSKKFRR